MTALTQLWNNFEKHYGPSGYKFGYSDKELFYRFSVQDQRTGRAKIEEVGLGLPIEHYKKTWFRMMKDFENGKEVQGR